MDEFNLTIEFIDAISGHDLSLGGGTGSYSLVFRYVCKYSLFINGPQLKMLDDMSHRSQIKYLV
jgi:hypothetical protein